MAGVAVAATPVEEMDSQKQLKLSQKVSKWRTRPQRKTLVMLRILSGRDDTDGLDNAPQGSDGGQACYLEFQACDGLSVDRLDMKLASVADVLGMRLMAAFVGGERYRG